MSIKFFNSNFALGFTQAFIKGKIELFCRVRKRYTSYSPQTLVNSTTGATAAAGGETLPSLGATNSGLRRPQSMPLLVTDNFVRAPSGSNPCDLFQASSSVISTAGSAREHESSAVLSSEDSKLIRNCVDSRRVKRLPSPALSATATSGARSVLGGDAALEMPRKLPMRPSSAANAKFVPASAGECEQVAVIYSVYGIHVI